MKFLTYASVAALATTIATSASAAPLFPTDMERARAMTPQGTSFESELAREYRSFFIFEADEMYDWPDADHFAEKALAANAGQRVEPEKVADWNIDGQNHIDELNAARADLVAALNKGAADVAPHEAAVAQSRFDCWVEQQEEGWQYDDIAACKGRFHEAMAALGKAMAPKPAPKPVAQAPQPMPKPTLRLVPVTEQTVVYFDFDKASVNPQAKKTIGRFVNSIERKEEVEIVVTGHTDRAGPEDYNRKLSERRAQSVRDVLVEQGLKIRELEELDVEAKGETQPAVPTPDGVREQRNRRVVIQGYGLRPVTQNLGQLPK